MALILMVPQLTTWVGLSPMFCEGEFCILAEVVGGVLRCPGLQRAPSFLPLLMLRSYCRADPRFLSEIFVFSFPSPLHRRVSLAFCLFGEGLSVEKVRGFFLWLFFFPDFFSWNELGSSISLPWESSPSPGRLLSVLPASSKRVLTTKKQRTSRTCWAC